MTVNNNNNRNDFVGTGTVAIFPYTFRIFSKTDLLVKTRTPPSVDEVTLVVDVDYTVQGVKVLEGGTITLIPDDLPLGTVLAIRRVRPLVQETDIKNQGAYQPEDIEDALDHQIFVDQQLNNDIEGSFNLPDTVSPEDVSTEIPVPQSLAFLRWNAEADALENATAVTVSGTVIIPGGTGILVKQSPSSAVLGVREIIANEGLEVADGDAVSGNPTIGISTSGVSNIKIGTDQVDARTIGVSAVPNSALQSSAVDTRVLGVSAVTNIKVGTDQIDQRTIAVSGVANPQMATDSVDARVLQDASVSAAILAPGAITASALGAGAVSIVAASGATVGNTTVETDIISHTFAAGELTVGDEIVMKAIGTAHFNATPHNSGKTYRARIAGTVIADMNLGGAPFSNERTWVEVKIFIVTSTLALLRGEMADLTNLGIPSVDSEDQTTRRVASIAIADIASNPLEFKLTFQHPVSPNINPSYDGSMQSITHHQAP